MAVKLTKSKYIKGVHPSETPLGIYKDADTKDLRVFDEKGNIESINAITIPGPQGPQGVAGPIGPTGASGINWMGVWDSETTYAANDAVSYDGSSYFASGASTNDLPDDGVPWYPLAMQGATGPQGPQGPQGNTGPAGTSTSAAGLVASGSVIVPINETVNLATTTLFTGAIDSRSGRIDVTFGSGNSIQPGAFAKILIFNTTVTLNSIVLLTPRFANAANTSIDTISIVNVQNGTFTLEVKAGSNANFNGFSINFAVINP
jgi:hypothetical protein